MRSSSSRRKDSPISTPSLATKPARRSYAATPPRQALPRAWSRASPEQRRCFDHDPIRSDHDLVCLFEHDLRANAFRVCYAQGKTFPDHALRRRWRQEVDVVLGGELDHLIRILLLHIVNGPEQIIEPAGRGHPEQRFGVLS